MIMNCWRLCLYGKLFLDFALPAVAAQLINILYNLVDKMFIGHIPGVGKQALEVSV